MRKDVSGSDPTEYIYFNGEPIAEHDPTTGDWSDYIYANGKRIAKADNFENRVHVHGVTCSSCGVQYAAFEFPNAGGLNGYAIQSGDKLYVRQTQFGNMQAGVGLNFTDGSYSAGLPLYDSDPQQETGDRKSGTSMISKSQGETEFPVPLGP